MPRVLPAGVELPSRTPKRDARTVLTYDLEVVTPMVGGFAVPGKTAVDLRAKGLIPHDMPDDDIRPAEIMGNLRAWWRIRYADRFTPFEHPLAELAAAEDAIFGSGANAGKVQIGVTVTRRGKKAGQYITQAPYSYALWPLAPMSKHEKPDPCAVTIETRFTVTLRMPRELGAEISPAMDAWIAYGGVGARTRRGCGSLRLWSCVVRIDGVDHKRTHPTRVPQQHGAKAEPDLTALPGSVLAWQDGPANKRAPDAWAIALQAYQGFRRGTDDRASRARSPYPEADTIRTLAGEWAREPSHPVQGFPRADLGLPIVVHFIGNGDPGASLIHATDDQDKPHRFASPVITKPLQVGDKFRPMIAFLDSPNVWRRDAMLEVKDRDGKRTRLTRRIPPEDIELTAADRALIGPMRGMPIREALEDHLQNLGWTRTDVSV